MKKGFKDLVYKWLLSFDNKDETGMDYKKLTSFWFVMVVTWMIFSYTVKQVKLFWFGVQVIFNDGMEDFKWVLGLCLAFILVLTYFTNSKTLTEFIEKLKNLKDDTKDIPLQ